MQRFEVVENIGGKVLIHIHTYIYIYIYTHTYTYILTMYAAI